MFSAELHQLLHPGITLRLGGHIHRESPHRTSQHGGGLSGNHFQNIRLVQHLRSEGIGAAKFQPVSGEHTLNRSIGADGKETGGRGLQLSAYPVYQLGPEAHGSFVPGLGGGEQFFLTGRRILVSRHGGTVVVEIVIRRHRCLRIILRLGSYRNVSAFDLLFQTGQPGVQRFGVQV